MTELSLVLQNAITELYMQSGKSRRDNSVDLAFRGPNLSLDNVLSILGSLRPNLNNTAGDGGKESERPFNWVNPTLQLDSINRIIKYYSRKGRIHSDQGSSDTNILFMDSSSFQIVRDDQPPFWRVVPRLIVVTYYALFIMEPIQEEDAQKSGNDITSYRPSPGTLCLKRMVPFCAQCFNIPGANSTKGGSNGGEEEKPIDEELNYAELARQCHGYMERVHLSRQADGCVVLMVKTPGGQQQPDAKLLEQQQSLQRRAKQEWQRDSANNRTCAVSGESFSLLRRRHHCRVSGLCVSNAYSSYTQNLPDLNHIWGEEPQRVCDPFIGLASSDPLEDIVLLSDRKTELAAIIALCLAGHVDPSDEPPADGGAGLALGRFITITDRAYLRFSNVESLSLLPAFQIDFASRPRVAPGESVVQGTESDDATVNTSTAADLDRGAGRMPRKGKGRGSRRKGRTVRVSVPLSELDAVLVEGVLTVYSPAPDPMRDSICSSTAGSFDSRAGESSLWTVFPSVSKSADAREEDTTTANSQP